jgi:Aspartyl protease
VKFPYRKEPASPNPAHPERYFVLRPRIRIRITHQGRAVDLLALVDSGADDCLFPLEVAQRLGIPLDPERSHRYAGIGQGAITAAFTTVTVEVGGWPFSLYAGFSEAPTIIPILGQHGLFNLFEVRFNLRKEILELRALPST